MVSKPITRKANGSEPMVKSMYGSFYLLGVHVIWVSVHVMWVPVHVMWIPVNLTGKIFNGWIRYLRFNSSLH